MLKITRGNSDEDRRIDDLTLDNYVATNSEPTLKEVVYLIPAYREKDNIQNVVAGLPKMLLGHGCSTVVVVDGDDDGTYDLAIKAGAKVCVAPVNRGQGAALRVGYKIASKFGADYILTVDADGQCDPSDFTEILKPLIEEGCDLVLGSRVKGQNLTKDITRRFGVTFFAKLITFLVGQQLTDTANPLRAMTAQMASSLTLTQNQFQASEVIIDAILNGYMVVERPMTMLMRAKGTSKKGKNFTYGYNYFKAVINTYLREKFKKSNSF